MSVKKNVSVFNEDVAKGTGYKYTASDRVSVRLANERMTRGIREAADFRGKSVIDIGCGDGTFTVALAHLGPTSILALDPAENAILAGRDLANKLGLADRITFNVYDVYDLDKLGQRFDIAVLRGVLHHLPDAAPAVALAGKVANEIVILEPNGANPVLKVIEKVSPYHREHEEQSFLPSTIDRWLSDAGFAVRYRKVINFVPLFCPAPLARFLRLLEPAVESIPGLRTLCCGQYVVRGELRA